MNTVNLNEVTIKKYIEKREKCLTFIHINQK